MSATPSARAPHAAVAVSIRLTREFNARRGEDGAQLYTRAP